MCGILFGQAKKDRSAIKPIIKRYRHQASRGKDGYGYIPVGEDSMVTRIVRRESEDEIMKELVGETSKVILFHHRTPTSLPNYAEATHPMVVKHKDFKYDYYVIHNGVIHNADLLYAQYKEAGIVFQTEMITVSSDKFVNNPDDVNGSGFYSDTGGKPEINDSEVMAVDLAHFMEGKQTYFKSSGSVAFIAFQTTKEGKIVNLLYGHNSGSPMVEEEDKTLFILKSIGHGTDVKEDTVFIRDWVTGKTTTKEMLGLKDFFKRTPAGFGSKADDAYDAKHYSPSEDSPAQKYTRDSLDKELDTITDVPLRFIEPRERHLEWKDEDYARGAEEFDRHKYEHGNLSGLPIIEMESLGFNLSDIQDEIKDLIAEGDEHNAHILKELGEDLEKCIDVENFMATELNETRTMLKTAYNQKFEDSEVQLAQSMIVTAEANLREARKQRQAVSAELEAYLPTSPSEKW